MPEKLKAKVFTFADLKLDSDSEGAGTFEATFATLDAIDRDGDSYDPGVFGGQDVKISQYNHGSWGGGASALPIGVGKIFERGNKAVVKGEFNMGNPDAVKTYDTLKYLHTKGHGVEWSFALPDTEWRMAEVDGRRVRVFTSITVPEVSPVLMGAGIDTELLSIKSGKEEDETKNQDDDKMKFIDHIDRTTDAVENLVDRACKVADFHDGKGRTMARRTKRRLKIHSEALHDAAAMLSEQAARLDELLIDPTEANEELKALAQKLEEN